MRIIDIVKSDSQILYTKEDVIKLLEQQRDEYESSEYLMKVFDVQDSLAPHFIDCIESGNVMSPEEYCETILEQIKENN